MSKPIVIEITPGAPGKYHGWVGEAHVAHSAEPLFAGARVLLKMGYDPEELVTTRHRGKGFDNFVPLPLGKAAKLTVTEPDLGPPRIRPYVPFSGGSISGPGTTTDAR